MDAFSENGRAPASQVKLVVLDVDGVLTDGSVALDVAGAESKRFQVFDGTGIRLLLHYGFEVGLLSARQSPVVAARAQELGMSFYHDGVVDKRPKLEEILEASGYSREQLCYVGDDIIDLSCLLLSGFPVAVANARPEVKRVAAYVTRQRSDEGAVREVAELLLKAQGRWDSVLQRSLS